MNTATSNLEQEHIHILRLIIVMEKMALANSHSINHLEKVVSLIKNFADGLHHAKEERLLFPMMISKGYSADQGPVGVMLREHVEGRYFVKGMTEGIGLFKEGKDSGLAKVYENFRGYIDLLRSHISKENNVLFRLADNLLSGEEQKVLLEKFAEVEDNEFSKDALNESISAINELEDIYVNRIS